MFCSEGGKDISYGRNESRHSCISDHIKRKRQDIKLSPQKNQVITPTKSPTRRIRRMT